jgi:hypothetical protein
MRFQQNRPEFDDIEWCMSTSDLFSKNKKEVVATCFIFYPILTLTELKEVERIPARCGDSLVRKRLLLQWATALLIVSILSLQ